MTLPGTRKKLLILSALTWLLVTQPAGAKTAKEIYDETGVKGGLIVHIGCGDGKVTAELFSNESFLVHGLDKDKKSITKARELIQLLDIYGKVSIDRLTCTRLPYTDDLVNLVVSEYLGDIGMDEVMRVLAPNGVAYIRQNGRWVKTIKEWPEEIDEWTHFLCNASNNAVAKDSVVGPPRKLKWSCGPLWSRSHEFTSSLTAMVTAKGRIFYIVDEGLTGVTGNYPEKWTLVARDAFNGVLLWKKELPKWGWKSKALRSIPATVPMRIVAEGDKVFVTLGYDAPVSVIDAATSKILENYKETTDTEELRILEGILILRRSNDSILAIDTTTGKKLWEANGKIQPLSLAANDGRVFYQADGILFCTQIISGKELWQLKVDKPISRLLAHKEKIILLSSKNLQAISVKTGKALWSNNAGVSRAELFIANDQVWHWEQDTIVGRDIETGEVTSRPDTDDVFTPGHHLRCYQSKATEKYLITPNRGVEFVGLRGSENVQNDWMRGSCRYGVIPSNGLLYVPPHPCLCYPGVLLTGFNAFSSDSENVFEKQHSSGKRLERGKAYKEAEKLAALKALNTNDWPTYRHDPRRSGATDSKLSEKLDVNWIVRLGGRLTPPVIAEDLVFIAQKDKHTINALHISDGSKSWTYTAGGRIDSAPTVYGKLVLFGSADGRVYCLRASDGELVWRFTAAPSNHLIISFGQLESPWRVHGSVLVKNGVAYFTAGRSSFVDGGIQLFGIDIKTGKELYETQLDTWSRTRQDAEHKPFVAGYHMEGANSDILVSQGGHIYLGQYKFDMKLRQKEVPYILPDPEEKMIPMDLSDQPFTAGDREPQKDYEEHQRKWLENTQPQLIEELKNEHGGYGLGQREMGLHLLSTGGFLDDSWFNRTYWMYSSSWPGYYLAHRGAKTGQLLVAGPEKTYAVQVYTSRNMQSPLFTPAEKGYLLYADRNDNEPVLDHRTRGTTKGWGYGRMEPPVWHDWVPVRIRAMVLAGNTLFVAGPPDELDIDDPMAALEGRKGTVLRAYSADNGGKLTEYKLDSTPVFDGMAVANGNLFIPLEDGTVVCMTGKK